MTNKILRASVLSVIGAALLSSSAAAEEFTFTIDSVRSSLTLSGAAFSSGGSPLAMEEQAPGSMIAPYTGSIVADITPTTFEFRGGLLDAEVTGSYEPGPALADYGFGADTGNPFIGWMVAAIRDGQFALSSGPLDTTPAADGFSFDVAGALATGTAGAVEFGGGDPGAILGALNGQSESLVGIESTAVAGLSGQDATWVTNGAVETLTLPLSILYHDFVPTAEFDLQLDGTIVATRVVPEPATLACIVLGAIGVFRRRR